jgi:formimidoylglutamate deiminase
VLLTVGADGCWSEITPNAAPEASRGATKLAGPVLPGLVDAHSHAFQRAIAGLTERSEDGDEDFWSWRDRMYPRRASRDAWADGSASPPTCTPSLLRAGYTQVCEFHYLHNDPQGRPYASPVKWPWHWCARRSGWASA